MKQTSFGRSFLSLIFISAPFRRSATYPESRFTKVKLPSRRPVLLFCLAPHRVFHALKFTLQAVGSYPTFSPLPKSYLSGGLFSVTLSVSDRFHYHSPSILNGMLP